MPPPRPPSKPGAAGELKLGAAEVPQPLALGTSMGVAGVPQLLAGAPQPLEAAGPLLLGAGAPQPEGVAGATGFGAAAAKLLEDSQPVPRPPRAFADSTRSVEVCRPGPGRADLAASTG